jgi:hypothetical protein
VYNHKHLQDLQVLLVEVVNRQLVHLIMLQVAMVEPQLLLHSLRLLNQQLPLEAMITVNKPKIGTERNNASDSLH